MDAAAFAAKRGETLAQFDKELEPLVRKYAPDRKWSDIVEAATVLWLETFEESAPGKTYKAIMPRFQRALQDHLEKTTNLADPPAEHEIQRITKWIGTYTVNDATYYASRTMGHETKRWVTQNDADVRESHRDVAGTTVGIADTFTVEGTKLRHPGEPVGPPEVWINCRCYLQTGAKAGSAAATSVSFITDQEEAIVAAAVDTNEDTTVETDDLPVDIPVDGSEGTADMPIPFHGVAAPVGVPSGDKRQLGNADGTGVTFRDMPIMFNYQAKTSGDPHGGSSTPGYIDQMWIDENNLIQYSGWLNPNHPDTSEVVDGISFGNIRGTSVDTDMIHVMVDDISFDTEEEAMDAMMNGILTIFDEVRIAGLTAVSIPAFQEAYVALGVHPDLMPPADATDPEQEPAGEDALVASAAGLMRSFAPGTHDGPGWLTNPEDTARIRRYWTKGKGAAKIRWGEPGDFNRCREELGKYVRPNFLAGTCANMHKEAIGVWPGQEDGARAIVASGSPAPILTLVEHPGLVAAGAPAVPPREWFEDPKLDGPTPFTVTDDGRVFGHVATWGVCHIGVQGACTTAPFSNSGYAYFRTGLVETDQGDVAVGHITIGSGHANPDASVSSAAAMAHYDNVGSVAADVAAGEDRHGIWVAGSIRYGLSDERRKQLKAAALSGDWRWIAGSYEMVAALAVNVPGYPIPRAELFAANGGGRGALVAAGIVQREQKRQADVLGIVAATADEVIAKLDRRDRAREAKLALRSIQIANAKKGLS